MALSGTGHGETPQSLATPAFAGLSTVTESGIKSPLTTGMTTDRKSFIFTARRGIMAEIEYPGVAQLVGRDIWDVEVGCSSHLTRTKTPLKSLISEGFSYSLSIAAQNLSCLTLSAYTVDSLGLPPRRRYLHRQAAVRWIPCGSSWCSGLWRVQTGRWWGGL